MDFGRYLKIFRWMMALFFVIALCRIGFAVQAEILDQGDSAHLEFEGLKEWKYKIDKKSSAKGTVVEIEIKPLSAQALEKITQFSNPQISKVQVLRNQRDGNDLIQLELKNSEVEFFDYLTDQPSRLIVDFFVENSSAPLLMAAKPNEKVTAQAKISPPLRKPASDVLLLSPMGIEGYTEMASKASGEKAAPRSVGSYNLFDGGDRGFDRFLIKTEEIREDAVLRAQENEYIDFPALEVPLLAWQRIEANRPVYEILPQPSEENKNARLLATLFEKNRDRVFEKTYQWFAAKYPESQYMELVSYMLADIKIKRWRKNKNQNDFDQAIVVYKSLIAKYPKSPLAERTSLLIGFLNLERGDNFTAIRSFQNHIENKNFDGKDKNFSKDVAKLGQAQSNVRIRQFDEALRILSEIEAQSAHASLREDAAYRKGDVHFLWKKFDQSISDYQRALRSFPHRKTDYPNSHFNQAESFFKKAKYKEALNTYVDFLKNYPVQTFSPYVLTRVAELLEILGAKPEKVTGALMENAFRFGDAPATLVSKIRLLAQKMETMKPKDVENAVKQVMEFSKKSDLNGVEQFATLLLAEGFNKRQEYPRAIDLLTKYYQQNPTSVNQDKFKKRISKNVVDKIHHQVEKGNFIESLKIHQKYADSWLKNSDRLDLKFDLGRAYEMAGVQSKASELYQDILNQSLSMKGTDLERQKKVTENVPLIERVQLRLAQVEMQKNEWQRALDFLSQIKKVDSLSEEEQIERVQMAVQLLMKKGDQENAKKYLVDLIDHWRGQTSLIAAPYLQLAELEREQNNPSAALETLKKLDLKLEDAKMSPNDFQAKALQKIVDIYSAGNRNDEAVPYFEKLLKIYEDRLGLASQRYKYGDVFFQKGEVKKAAEIWSQFKGTQSEFWKKLADEKMKSSDFEVNYKKYIQRIPAMSDSGVKE